MRYIFVIFLIIGSNFVTAAEKVMWCEDENNLKIYKLKKRILRDNIIEQRIDGQWVDWCRKVANCRKVEIFDSGGTLTEGFNYSWSINDPEKGVIADRIYWVEAKVSLDFEFQTRKEETRVYTYRNKREELTKLRRSESSGCGAEQKDKQGYFKKLKGKFEIILE